MGIDYGMGMTNIDRKTGIRYGVISAHDVGAFWYEESEMIYPDCVNSACEENDDCDCEFEPIACLLKNDEYFASHAAGSYVSDNDIFIEKSPYFTKGPFCSPCAPGAVYLRDASDDGEALSYCFGPDCFDDENPCPYPVWKIGLPGVDVPKLIFRPNDKRYTKHKK